MFYRTANIVRVSSHLARKSHCGSGSLPSWGNSWFCIMSAICLRTVGGNERPGHYYFGFFNALYRLQLEQIISDAPRDNLQAHLTVKGCMTVCWDLSTGGCTFAVCQTCPFRSGSRDSVMCECIGLVHKENLPEMFKVTYTFNQRARRGCLLPFCLLWFSCGHKHR